MAAPKAAGYIRVSTDDQAEHGYSLAEQRRLIGERAEREGWELVDVFADEGLSGGVPFAERPAGARALAVADEVDRLIVWKFDRFGRTAIDMLVVTAQLRERGCVVVSVTEASIEEASPDGDFMRGITALVAERERQVIGERVRMSIAARARQGKTKGGPRPYGYRYEDGQLVPVPHEVEIVRRIFAEFNAGQSMTAIARGLHGDGVPTMRGRHWRTSTVSGILGNPHYIGLVAHNGETFEGIHEPIVERETWERAADLLAARPTRRGRPPKGSHLFRGGLLRCECGEAMVPRTRDGYELYYCDGHAKLGADHCSQGAIRRAEIDTAVYRYFEQVGLDVEATRRQIAESRDRKLAEVRALRAESEAEASRAKGRLARVRRDYQDGAIVREDWAEQREQLTEEHEAAQAEVKRLRDQEHDVGTWGELEDAEAETLRQLAAIRQSIAGEVQDAEGVEAVRAALTRTFEGFTLHRSAPERVHVELAWLGDGKLWIEPVVREQAIEGYSENLRPVLRREPVLSREKESRIGLPTRVFFGPIPLRRCSGSVGA